MPLGRAGHRHGGADDAEGAGALAEGGGDHAEAEPQVGGDDGGALKPQSGLKLRSGDDAGTGSGLGGAG